MCDYSLHHVASRPAKVGDKLVTTRFFGTGTLGFAACGEPAAAFLSAVAVCLRPGTELAFDDKAKYRQPLRRWLPLLSRVKRAGKVAVFRQINMDQRNTHHDALEFADGTTVLLTRLRAGQRATVLQLPAELEPRTRAEGKKYPALVY
jgi:hypothetical protein